MSLLDGLKESLKNPLADNNDDMRFALESDFEFALERAVDVKLSPADIAAILNGEDDIDDAEDDIDDPNDDIDKDYVDSLEECDKATEAVLESLTSIADELNADEDIDDIDFSMDPEDEDEILSEESFLQMIEEAFSDDAEVKKVADTGESSIPKNSGAYSDDVDELDHDTGDELMPENIDDPVPYGDEKKIKGDVKALVGECEALLSALESDDFETPEYDRPAEECGSETGSASVIANVDDATPDGDDNDPAGAELDPDEIDMDDSAEEAHTDIPDDDENVEVKAIAENDDEDEEDVSLESILDSLLENPI